MDLDGFQLKAMDHLGYGRSDQPYPKVGDEFVPVFSCEFSEADSWVSVFAGNPEQRSELVSTGLWSYRALGELVSVDDGDRVAVAKCGPCEVPMPIEVSDTSLIGAFVGFDIARLDAWRA